VPGKAAVQVHAYRKPVVRVIQLWKQRGNCQVPGLVLTDAAAIASWWNVSPTMATSTSPGTQIGSKSGADLAGLAFPGDRVRRNIGDMGRG
jgi:hypothetical protein